MSATASPYNAFTQHRPASRDFMNQAACRSDNPTPENIRARAELFFPQRISGPTSGRDMRRRAAEAMTICKSCPVTFECENYRATLDIPFGVWGGITEADRAGRGVA
jgi:hypothetical protein